MTWPTVCLQSCFSIGGRLTQADYLAENGMDRDEAISFIKRNTNLDLWVKGRKFFSTRVDHTLIA